MQYIVGGIFLFFFFFFNFSIFLKRSYGFSFLPIVKTSLLKFIKTNKKLTCLENVRFSKSRKTFGAKKLLQLQIKYCHQRKLIC